MKIRIEVDEGLGESEVVIRCGRMDDAVRRIQRFVLEQSADGPKLVFYKKDEAFYFPLDEVLFFETDSEQVYAHTADDAFRIKYRLYELEGFLPRQFVRVAKGAIVNTGRVYSVSRDIGTASLVRFAGTVKQVYVSRHYYKMLKQRLGEELG